MRKTLPLALGLLVTACGTGAVNPLTFLTPDVRLHHLALSGVGLEGGTLDVVLAFNNPNKLSVQGTRLQAGIDVDGNHFGDATLSDPFNLAANDTTLITVPVQFRWADLAETARAILNDGTVRYTLRGRFGMITPMCSQCDIPFSGEGTVPLLRR